MTIYLYRKRMDKQFIVIAEVDYRKLLDYGYLDYYLVVK